MEQLKELPHRHQQILAYIPNGSDTMLKRAEKVRDAEYRNGTGLQREIQPYTSQYPSTNDTTIQLRAFCYASKIKGR